MILKKQIITKKIVINVDGYAQKDTVYSIDLHINHSYYDIMSTRIPEYWILISKRHPSLKNPKLLIFLLLLEELNHSINPQLLIDNL